MPHPERAPEGAQVLRLMVAGSSCTDWSAFGSQQHAAGPTVFYLLVLLRVVLETLPDLFLHENVPSFPTELLLEVLHEAYVMEEMMTSPVDGAFPIERRRKYCLCRRRTTTRRDRDEWESVF